MTLVGKGTILSKIVGKGIVSVKVLGSYTLNTLSPQQAPVVQYNLIDGGNPDTIYGTINGFNLISGGGA